jgi:hypothetical protein
MQKKTIFFVGIVLCLIVLAAWGYYWYQKPRTGVTGQKAAYQLTATQLYETYQQDEKKADSLYLGKVIEVSGAIDNLQKTDSTVNILLSAGQPTGGINCSLPAEEGSKTSALSKGATVRVKGRCVGFLMDVTLVDAVIINNQ